MSGVGVVGRLLIREACLSQKYIVLCLYFTMSSTVTILFICFNIWDK